MREGLHSSKDVRTIMHATFSLQAFCALSIKSCHQTPMILTFFSEAKTTLKPVHCRADSTSCIPKIAVQTRNLHRVYKVSGEFGRMGVVVHFL